MILDLPSSEQFAILEKQHRKQTISHIKKGKQTSIITISVNMLRMLARLRDNNLRAYTLAKELHIPQTRLKNSLHHMKKQKLVELCKIDNLFVYKITDKGLALYELFKQNLEDK